MSWLGRTQARDVVVAAQPEDETGTAEARLRRFRRPALIRLRAEAAGTSRTRLRVESDALAWAPVFRRFRGDLLLLERPTP